MNGKKSLWKRVFSCFLSVALMATVLPVSAFAALTDEAKLYIVRAYVDRTGNYTGSMDATSAEAGKLKYNHEVGRKWLLTGGVIDTYVYSTDMDELEQDGSVVPYLYDEAGRKWELYQVTLSTESKIEDLEDDNQIVLIDRAAINEAANLDDYNISTEEMTLDPVNNTYRVWFAWQLAAGQPETVEKYHVSYELNLPTECTTVFPVISDGKTQTLETDDGDGSKTEVESALSSLSADVYNTKPYTVSDFNSIDYLYKDFLAFGGDSYYDFAGWKVDGDESKTQYQIDQEIDDISTLADNAKNVVFQAVWTKIDPDQAPDADNLTLDAFEFENGTNRDALIVQSVGSEEVETDTLVTLNKDQTISYLVSATVDDALTTATNLNMTYHDGFAEFTFRVLVDKQLKFANEDQVTLTFTAEPNSDSLAPPVVLDTNSEDTINIPEASIQSTGNNGVYTITFDPDNVPTDSQTGKMDIQLTVKWNTTQTVGQTARTVPMRLSGLDFKLKDGVTTAGSDFKIETSANITGKIDLTKKAESYQIREYYRSIAEIFDLPEWQERFEVNDTNYPTTFIYALPAINEKLADIDLSADSTVKTASTAIMVESTPITLTPADMTIYMGGDGGYDAVVNKDGHTVTSNSLPHPIFQLDGAPSGVTFNNQTFTNAESGNSWTLVPETGAANYYHFVNKGSTAVGVRVQYSNENGAVTSDEFNPATEKDVFTEYNVSVYTGDTKGIVTAVASDGKNYLINAGKGTLTVRAVENKNDPTSDIVATEPTSAVKENKAVAVAPADTTYTLNDTDVQLPADHGASLLFDNIITSDANGKERMDKLEETANTWLNEKFGTTSNTRNLEFKYLDLVDANNGNAWIKASNPVTIYWGYPATTDQNTTFKLLHFKDLHRDTSGGDNTGFDPGDIANSEIEEVKVTNNSNGISFTVKSGGFSPFVLVWETAAEEPDPGPNPGGGGDSHSDPTGNLTISLGGNGGNEDFIFTVIFTDEDGDELENNFYYNGDYTGTIGSGDEITLTGGDKIVIRNLPEGTRYEVIIETADGYTATSTGAEGVIRTSGNEAAFSVTPTVVLADPSVTGVTRWLNTTDHMAYLSGYPGGTFGPDNSMTRAEVAQMFYALLLNKDVTITKSFSDVPADAWYATAVNTLASLGMVSGDPDGTFRPNDPITRAEFCVIALAFAYEPDNAVCYFGDVSRSDWFYTYVAQAASYGWIGGYTNGNFGPNDRITRAQVTTIVNNMLGRAADRDYVIDHQADLVQFSDLTRAHWGYFQIMEATNAHNYTKSNGTESWR